jgi:hypothetical protein
VAGDKVKAEVGGNVKMASLQDISNYSSNQHHVGVSGRFVFSSGGVVDVSFGHTSIDANYASVNPQTGIVAASKGSMSTWRPITQRFAQVFADKQQVTLFICEAWRFGAAGSSC